MLRCGRAKERKLRVEWRFKFLFEFIDNFLIIRIFFAITCIIIFIHSFSIEFKTRNYCLNNIWFHKWRTYRIPSTKIIFIGRIANKVRLYNFFFTFLIIAISMVFMSYKISTICCHHVHSWPFIFGCPKIHCNTRKLLHFSPIYTKDFYDRRKM
jgi:hypothetical protein